MLETKRVNDFNNILPNKMFKQDETTHDIPDQINSELNPEPNPCDKINGLVLS